MGLSQGLGGCLLQSLNKKNVIFGLKLSTIRTNMTMLLNARRKNLIWFTATFNGDRGENEHIQASFNKIEPNSQISNVILWIAVKKRRFPNVGL